ncbi:MAG: exodeoxyribonuclease III [Sphaerochaetaceae bacterium]|jgi:exodeoxyribonuclease-3
MRFVTWNVNGLRACLGKGFMDFLSGIDADVVCLQETKLQPGQIELPLEGYRQYWNYAQKKGYSGTAVFTKAEPLAVTYGIGIPEFDSEGRVITVEFRDFQVVCVYTPNSQRGLARLDYRMLWDDAFRSYIAEMDLCKPVLVCGDLNVAHQEIDLKNPKSNVNNAGFTPQERQKFTQLLQETGLVDSFRKLYPDKTDAYSWWSYMFNARENNVGWRIDYWLVSGSLEKGIKESCIEMDVMGSDHAPCVLDLDL